MKTKHAQRKAEKLKRTRSVKQGIVMSRDMVVRGLNRDVGNTIRRYKKNYAADGELVSRIKKLESQVNQIFS